MITQCKTARCSTHFVAAIATAVALAVAPAWAASGDPEAYGVTITRIELSKDGGASYVTRFEGYADVNLAAPGVGAPIADLGKDTPLPKGTYNRLRVTLGPTLYLKGYVNHGGATLFTNGGADLVGYETNAAAANAPGATYAVSSVTIPNTARTFEQAIDIHVGSTMPALHLAFDLTGLITQTAGVPAVSAPAVILELEAA